MNFWPLKKIARFARNVETFSVIFKHRGRVLILGKCFSFLCVVTKRVFCFKKLCSALKADFYQVFFVAKNEAILRYCQKG